MIPPSGNSSHRKAGRAASRTSRAAREVPDHVVHQTSTAVFISSNHEWMYVPPSRPLKLQFILTTVRVLDVVKVFAPVLPEVELPDEKISLDEKVIFTIGAGFVFLMSHMPVYGLVKDATLKLTDPYPALRPLFALEQGLLLELGLLPVVTAALVWQVAAGLRLVKVNFNYAHDRELFQSAQKLTAFALAAVFGVALVASGYYEPVLRRAADGSVSFSAYVLLLLQVVGWNMVLTLVVEVIDKGYGFGSGIVSLMCLNSATGLVRDVVGLEVVSATPGGEPQTYGVASYLVKSLISMNWASIKEALVGIFFRAGFPTLGGVVVVLAVIILAIALQNYRYDIPIRSNKVRGSSNVFPVRLMYTGALPVIFAFTVLANVQLGLHFVSVFTEPFYPLVARVLESRADSGKVVSGLAFYVSAPASFAESLLSPIRAVVFSGLVLGLAAAFGRFWAGISGSAPKDIASQFRDQGIVIAGKRDVSVAKELSKIIPNAAMAGAFTLAAVSLAGELTGAAGKSVAVAVGVSGAFAVIEDFMVDFQQSGGASQIMGSLAGYQ